MSDFPAVIYLHDGQDDITWSEHEEVDGVRYVKSDCCQSEEDRRVPSEPMLENNAKYYAWKCKTESMKSDQGFHFYPPKGTVIAGYCFDFGIGIDYSHFFSTHKHAVAKSEELMDKKEIFDGSFEIVPVFCAQVGI